MIPIQHFIFGFQKFQVDSIFFESNHECQLKNSESISFELPPDKEGSISFDGIGNSLPLQFLQNHTMIENIKIISHLKTQHAVLSIIHVHDDGSQTTVFEDEIDTHEGQWESPWLPLTGPGGRYYLSVSFRGDFLIGETAWWSDAKTDLTPSFLVSTTTFKREKYVLDLIPEILAYKPLARLNLSFLVVDNGRTLSMEQFPEDSRLTLFSQTNLGGTGGFMRAFIHAQNIGAKYLAISDDDIVMHPETLYRMIIFQILSKSPTGFGALMLSMQQPTIAMEQGGFLDLDSIANFKTINTKTSLSDAAQTGKLYEEHPPAYSGWWLFSAPVESLSFIPPYFIYADDILTGYLLKRKNVSTAVPPNCFVWHGELSSKISFWKRYFRWRNHLITRMILEKRLGWHHVIRMKSFWKSLVEYLACYDYELANLFSKAVIDALTPPQKWISEEKDHAGTIQALMKIGPKESSLGDSLSKQNQDLIWKNKSKIQRGLRKIFYYVSVASYLNPFARTATSNGRLVSRFDGDYEAWKWVGFSRIAVIDHNNDGYVCQRSWSRLLGSLILAAKATVLYFMNYKKVAHSYSRFAIDASVWLKIFDQK